MPVHTERNKGIERLVHTGQMNIFTCDVCGNFCGYTWGQPGVKRFGFCSICDESTDQTVRRKVKERMEDEGRDRHQN